MFLLKLLLIIAWLFFYIPLTNIWKYPILLLLLINIYYQKQYKKTGKDVTVVATGFMVNKVLTLTDKLNREGIDVEVIDPRTLVPLDVKTIVESIKKTRKLLVVDEAPKTCGAAAEIITVVMEEAFDYLDVVPMRVTSYDVPIPFNPTLEDYVIPNEERIENAIKKLVS